MKNKSFVFTLSLLVMILFTGCEQKMPVGEWLITGSAEAIIFYEDGTFLMLQYSYDQTPGGTVPGVGYGMPQDIPDTGKWRERDNGNYAIDMDKDPGWIDLIIRSQGTPRRLQGLIEFKSNDVIYMQLDRYGTGRPAVMNEREAVRLSRAATGEIKR